MVGNPNAPTTTDSRPVYTTVALALLQKQVDNRICHSYFLHGNGNQAEKSKKFSKIITMSHAYVRFEIDKTFYITKVSDIKNFKFKNKEDFDKQKLFEVLWTDGHYYNAQIVLLSGSYILS